MQGELIGAFTLQYMLRIGRDNVFRNNIIKTKSIKVIHRGFKISRMLFVCLSNVEGMDRDVSTVSACLHQAIGKLETAEI